MEWRREGYVLTDETERVDLDAVHRLLSTTYWAAGRSRETVARSVQASLCFSLFEQERQIGFTRVVTDRATFAWVCDVIIEEGSRGRGLARWMLTTLLEHGDLQLRLLLLGTRDAGGLYEKLGFSEATAAMYWRRRLD
ncbi:GNAT family N-acetyltransferase [Paenibacillus athensensis]|uniref:GNAT family N-acetyltransferase n=1 Tax=Paenibacillus athensensis TaxID=1967502 RepID=A0A4Y8PRL4_9BACL|nr:GNAT family N-acetyltransferase [Paenibacillus athensensis]MCD1260761.1 GNAT family N-acetyltransferase [Paenibacillus athensensis]